VPTTVTTTHTRATTTFPSEAPTTEPQPFATACGETLDDEECGKNIQFGKEDVQTMCSINMNDMRTLCPALCGLCDGNQDTTNPEWRTTTGASTTAATTTTNTITHNKCADILEAKFCRLQGEICSWDKDKNMCFSTVPLTTNRPTDDADGSGSELIDGVESGSGKGTTVDNSVEVEADDTGASASAETSTATTSSTSTSVTTTSSSVAPTTAPTTVSTTLTHPDDRINIGDAVRFISGKYTGETGIVFSVTPKRAKITLAGGAGNQTGNVPYKSFVKMVATTTAGTTIGTGRTTSSSSSTEELEEDVTTSSVDGSTLGRTTTGGTTAASTTPGSDETTADQATTATQP
jgi:hypothetical protein